jgi:hypothetical protein
MRESSLGKGNGGVSASFGNTFYISLGANLCLYIFQNGIIGILKPAVGLGLQF